jgi:hypothetical protein
MLGASLVLESEVRFAARTILRTLAALGLWLQPNLAEAQTEPAELQATVDRVAAEGLSIGSPTGAGGDPQTSVAQPVFSAGRAAEVTTSFQPLLEAAGDPGGYRAFLERHGINFGLITTVAETYRNLRGGLRRGSADRSAMPILDGKSRRRSCWAISAAKKGAPRCEVRPECVPVSGRNAKFDMTSRSREQGGRCRQT